MKTTQRLLLTVIMATLGIYSNAQNVLPASGNVGIGTASPSTELQVEGTSTLSKTIIRDSARFDGYVNLKDSVRIDKKLTVDQDLRIKGKTIVDDNFRAKSNVVVLGTTRMKGNAVAEGNFRFLGLADSTLSEERFLMIKPNGRVESMEKSGLQNYLYDVDNGTACITGDDINGNVTYVAPIWQPTDYGVIYTGTSCPAKVGIGIANPIARLDVRGDTYISSNTGIGVAPNNATRLYVKQLNPQRDALTVELINNTTGNTVTGIGINTIVNRNDRKALNVHNAQSNTDVFSVFGDGKIVVKTDDVDAPTIRIVNETLNQDVFRVYADGYIEAKRLRLSHTIWADYVFDENYDLKTIYELEKYINDNKHLPNIPNAETIQKEGVDMGEMNVLFLEKIEELSLYVIALQKQIDQLQSQLDKK